MTPHLTLAEVLNAVGAPEGPDLPARIRALAAQRDELSARRPLADAVLLTREQADEIAALLGYGDRIVLRDQADEDDEQMFGPNDDYAVECLSCHVYAAYAFGEKEEKFRHLNNCPHQRALRLLRGEREETDDGE